MPEQLHLHNLIEDCGVIPPLCGFRVWSLGFRVGVPEILAHMFEIHIRREETI